MRNPTYLQSNIEGLKVTHRVTRIDKHHNVFGRRSYKEGWGESLDNTEIFLGHAEELWQNEKLVEVIKGFRIATSSTQINVSSKG